MKTTNLVPGLFLNLIKSQTADQKRKSMMHKGMTTADLGIRKYRMAVFHRALCSVAIPIFVWLILETFFK